MAAAVSREKGKGKEASEARAQGPAAMARRPDRAARGPEAATSFPGHPWPLPFRVEKERGRERRSKAQVCAQPWHDHGAAANPGGAPARESRKRRRRRLGPGEKGGGVRVPREALTVLYLREPRSTVRSRSDGCDQAARGVLLRRLGRARAGRARGAAGPVGPRASRMGRGASCCFCCWATLSACTVITFNHFQKHFLDVFFK